MMETGLIPFLSPQIFLLIPIMLDTSVSIQLNPIIITISLPKATRIKIPLLSEYLQDLDVPVFTVHSTLKVPSLSSRALNPLELILIIGTKTQIFFSLKDQEKQGSLKELINLTMMKLLPNSIMELCKDSIKNSLNSKIKLCT